MLVVQSWGTGFKVGAGKGGSQSNALISYAWNDYISHISLHYSEVFILSTSYRDGRVRKQIPTNL